MIKMIKYYAQTQYAMVVAIDLSTHYIVIVYVVRNAALSVVTWF